MIVYVMKSVTRELLNGVFILAGILSAGMGIHGFLLSSRFIDGGVTGISMLLAKVLGLPLPALILAINLPFILLGYRQIGRAFAIRSATAILGLSLCLATIHYPDVTPDKLLTSVFGGFFIGAGMGLAIRGGAVLDGTDIAAHPDQQAKPSLSRRRCDPRDERRNLPDGRFFSRCRVVTLLDSHLCRCFKDARLSPSRDRAIQRDHHYIRTSR